MADNVDMTPGSGKTIAADDVSGILHQRVKISVGDDGAATDMSSGAGSVEDGTPRVTLADDDPAVVHLSSIENDASDLTRAVNGQYEAIAASSTDHVLGGAGAAGDYLHGLLVIPATTSPGAVSIKDGVGAMTIFPGGASSVGDLKPFFVPLAMISATGAWSVTTGADVSAIAVGKFT